MTQYLLGKGKLVFVDAILYGKYFLTIAVCVLFSLLVTTGCRSANARYDPAAWGLTYHLRKLDDPRPNRIHILRVDLSEGKIRPVIVLANDPDGDGPVEAALTDPLKLAQGRLVLAFINTNPWDSFPDETGKKNRSWFEGQPVNITGLAASGGSMRSPAPPDRVVVWIGARGRAFIGEKPAHTFVVEGMGGFEQTEILKDGIVIAPHGGPLHPRTAIGVDQSGDILWLVVVDGRQKAYSEGMTRNELGHIMREIGCWHALNMDGGGSSIMGLVASDGQLRVVNNPSDRKLPAKYILRGALKS